jgi:hypothetical protein
MYVSIVEEKKIDETFSTPPRHNSKFANMACEGGHDDENWWLDGQGTSHDEDSDEEVRTSEDPLSDREPAPPAPRAVPFWQRKNAPTWSNGRGRYKIKTYTERETAQYKQRVANRKAKEEEKKRAELPHNSTQNEAKK